jgi:thioredoxin-related protein
MDIPYPIEVIDIDSNRDAAMEYGIRGVPHMILLDENNNVVTRIGGAVSKKQIEEAFSLD